MAHYQVTVRDGVERLRHDFDKKCIKVSDVMHGCLAFQDKDGRCLGIIPTDNISAIYLMEDEDERK